MKRNGKLLPLFLSLCLLLPLALPAAMAVDSAIQLETIRALGIMTGDENGEMNLSSPVTRAQFVKMMTAASVYRDSIGDGSGSALFQDVKSDHWASGYIKLAVEQEWMTGYVDGTFRPDSTITLEEGCTALLRLLGYSSDSLSGSYPTAQLTKARAVGLLDDLSVSQGEDLTRQDCVTLFYNLLTAENSDGQVYGTTLGYTVSNGEVDYSALVTADTEGPYVAGSGGLSLPFSDDNVTVYYNGSLSSLSAAAEYDVYYYNENLRTVWIYHDRVTGTLTAVSPSRAAPTSVTVAGNEYELGTSGATYKVSSQGSFSAGDTVTLLLGMNGEVVDVISPVSSSDTTQYYGVVVSSQKGASSADTGSSSSTSEQTVTQVACSDGVVRTFYHSGSAHAAGRLVLVTSQDGSTTVKTLSSKSLSGRVSSDGSRFAGYSFAEDVEILDTDSEGSYLRVYPSRLAGSTLDSADVLYYTLDENGEIDRLILRDVTGDLVTYVYLTEITSHSGSMSSSASYTYLLDGESRTVSSSAVYSVESGGAAILYDDGEVRRIRQLSSARLTGLSELSAEAGNETYALAEEVQVYLKSGLLSTSYYLTTLSEINAEDYVLTGWYDDLDYAAGGRIRIIIAETG